MDHQICDQKTCDEPATCWYYWVTDQRKMYACKLHGASAAGVAGALGYRIQLHDLKLEEESDG